MYSVTYRPLTKGIDCTQKCGLDVILESQENGEQSWSKKKALSSSLACQQS